MTAETTRNAIPEVYHKLARHLDELPGGFPPTESGVELRILQHLFTPQEAALALHLSLLADAPPAIAQRARLPLRETTALLEEMDRKRLIYTEQPAGKPKTYMIMQFVVGFWEGQVDLLDREIVELFEEYLPLYGKAVPWGQGPQMRVIPIHESIPTKGTVLPYEHIDEIISGRTRYAVSNCICRQEMRIIGHDCHKPLETCLAFDSAADYVVRVGRGRAISRDEALAILDQAESAGLVLQTGNDQGSGNICMCCGDCCGILRSIKMFERPAEQVASPFVAVFDETLCAACGACIERCPMEALTSDASGDTRHHPERCIGCGLCVTACPTGALELFRKAEAQQRPVPKNIVELYFKVGHARGKMGPRTLLKWAAQAGVSRVAGKISRLEIRD